MRRVRRNEKKEVRDKAPMGGVCGWSLGRMFEKVLDHCIFSCTSLSLFHFPSFSTSYNLHIFPVCPTVITLDNITNTS